MHLEGDAYEVQDFDLRHDDAFLVGATERHEKEHQPRIQGAVGESS